jgi:ribosomal protein RSM22 (predicted rRNA methylase)
LEKLWGLANKLLILIEPGTKVAFESLMQIRQSLLSQGAHLMAPCPHSNHCPFLGKDWCHFSARVERSSLHRKTKDATLNYEDEKFSYLIFSKNKFEPCQSRVLRRPFKGTGFVKLQLCSTNEIEMKTITKKDKINYSRSKKVECGDDFILL